MAKLKGEMGVSINGQRFAGREVTLPSTDKPYWTVILQDGGVVYATGQVHTHLFGKEQTDAAGVKDVLSEKK